MTLADIKTKIYELTQSDTNLYPSANMLININSWYRNVQTEILASQDNWDFDDTNTSDYPILRTDLNAGQQAYTLPTSTLELKRVEVTYDGTNWSKMTEFDIGERLSATAANNLGDFSTSSPFYDNQYGSIFLYPIPAASMTVRIFSWAQFANLPLLTTEMTLAPAYYRAIKYNLAVELALNYRRQIMPNHQQIANTSLGEIRDTNTKDFVMQLDPVFYDMSNGYNTVDGRFNIFRGW